jgi:hypothetical protein
VALEPQLYDRNSGSGSSSSSSSSTYHNNNNTAGSSYNSSNVYYGNQDTTTTNPPYNNGTNNITAELFNTTNTTISTTIPSYDHNIFVSEKKDYLRGVSNARILLKLFTHALLAF